MDGELLEETSRVGSVDGLTAAWRQGDTCSLALLGDEGLLQGTSDPPSAESAESPNRLTWLYFNNSSWSTALSAADLEPQESLFWWGSAFHPNSIKKELCERYSG